MISRCPHVNRRRNVAVRVKILFLQNNTHNQTKKKGNMPSYTNTKLSEVTRLLAGSPRNRGSIPGTDRRLTCKVSTSTLGHILPPVQWVPEFLSPRIRCPGREVHHKSLPTNDLVVRVDLLLLLQQRCNLSQASPLPLVCKNCLQLRIRNFRLYLRRYS